MHRIASIVILIALVGGCQSAVEQSKTSPESAEAQANPAAVAHMLAAKGAERRDDKVEAVLEWRYAVQADSTAPMLHLGLARALFAVGYDSIGIEHADICLSLDSTYVDAHSLLADYYRRNGDTDQELKHLEALAQLSDSDEHVWHLVHIYRSLGRTDDIQRVLGELAHRQTATPDDLLRWAHIAGSMHFDNSAESMYRVTRERWPDYERGIVEYGEFLDARDRIEEAEAMYLDGLDRYPRSPELNQRLAWLYTGQAQWGRVDSLMARVPVETEQDLAQREAWLAVLVQHDQNAIAIRHLNRLTPRFPDDDNIWVLLGQAYAAEKLYTRAVASFARALEIDSTAQAFSGLMVTSLQAGDLDLAENTGRAAVEVFPDDTRLQFLYGMILRTRNKWPESVGVFARLVASDSANVMWRFNYASSLERSGRFDDSVAEFQKLLAFSPDHATSLNYLGYMYADHGVKLDEALAMISRALEQEPDNPAYLDSMGWVLFRLGRYAEAKEYLNSAIARDDSSGEIFEHLGDVHRALDEPVEARSAWISAIRLGVEDPARVQAKLGALPETGGVPE